MTRTRIEIEQLALRMAVANGDVEWESRILSSFHRLSRAEAQPWTEEALEAWASAHRQVHDALVEGRGSPWTLRLCRLLYDQTERYRNLSVQPVRKVKRDVGEEHRELAEAAIARDADALCRLTETHFRETTRLILDSGFAGPSPAGRRKPRRVERSPGLA